MKVDIKKLRQALADKKRAGLAKVTELNALVARTDLTADETAKMNALDSEVTALEADVTKLQGQMDTEEKTMRRTALFTTVAAGSAGRTIGELNPEATGGFRSLTEFAVSVRRHFGGAGTDERLSVAASDPNINGGSAGEGFMVPPEYRQQIWEIVLDPVDLLGRVDLEPTNSNSVLMPKDETTPWGTTGVQAFWRAEAGAMTSSKLTTDGELVKLNELYAFVAASDELLSDAPRLQNRLTKKSGAAIRWKANDSIVWGDGVGKPKGLMKAGALKTIAKDSGQAAASLSVSNLANMRASLLGSGKDAFWLASSETLPQLMQLTIGNQPVWTPPGDGMQDAPAGRIMGLPLLFTEHCQTLGTLGDILLIDGMGYGAANKVGGGLDFASSIHLYFDQNLTAFRWTFRLAGQPYLSAPVSPPTGRGTFTKSHFVALATRS